MSIKVSLEHRTSYTFAHPVNVGPHVVRLRPAPHARTPIEAYSLQIEPANHFLNWQQDPFGNWQARIVFPEKVSKLEINVGVVADLMVINPFDFFIEEACETFPFSYEPLLAADLAPYLVPVPDPAGAVDAWRTSLQLPTAGMSTTDFLVAVNAAVNAAVGYSVRMEPGVQTPEHTLRSAIGSCRDSAWLQVAVLRQYGLAARFVSGYLVQLASDEKSLDGPSGPEEDFTDLHAWTEVYVPGAGWIGLDPTSALFAGEGHIPLSATPHPSSAAPIEGLIDPVEVEFGFSNVVTRVHEDPRVTKPYTDEQWLRIDALGEAVDLRLHDGDVRLTMGGEPTFVSLDDMVSAQWSTDADGPDKRRLAATLADALKTAYAENGVVHRGQGKWYPGEDLPRWNIALQWRADKEALWSDPSLFANPWDPEQAVTDAPSRAAALAAEVTRLLGLPGEHLLPAFEDPFAVVAADASLPDGSPPEHDPRGRNGSRDLLGRLDRGLNAATGHVLPLATGEDGWTAPAWRFRRGRLVLQPGTSPVGLRLPLGSISWTDPAEPGEPSYLVAGEPLAPGVPPIEIVAAEGAPTTALTFEGRDGFVHVFLPPTTVLEDYVTLLGVIERSAATLAQPIVIEGYGPPPDARLVQLVVTPDPGVIEVNVQPVSSWAEQREVTTTLYDLARRTRLSTEKFDLDGTHTGTGGGNHITLGGAQPVDSPMLRRPDLLTSMIGYWQRHPSLSYLFSGRFIGPTSQAPRFDEGRPEAVYEMEIAFREIARLATDEGRPWLVDRALRHLLTDLVGNTHRAEFCIDKMYSPDSSRGRLGLLELRGFEMPPHPQMALVQVLLVRSLVAMFWERPHTDPLVRWGTALHDDFLLPHGATADIRRVVGDLNAHGIEFEESWLAPFTEFRFPRIGVAKAGGVELELRAGIEPWLVLGEEASAGGTARYVDSSLERLQVSARGYEPGRHLITCQGVPVPMTATGTTGEYYAGVRYRAWQPWSALHPSIEVHAPLHFDVVDLHAATSLGGATYHVTHPGGRSYEQPPVNAQSAEARRSSRFEARGHTPGRVDVGALREAALRTFSAEYPHTLDLRRSGR
ncbi:MAG: transglutaminase family protein [Propionibacteriales bacterium]|nr:transglutaminase family protein [Propionibacteriales bacterium]